MASTAIPLDAGRALLRSLHPLVFVKALFSAAACGGLFAAIYVGMALMGLDWYDSYAGLPIIVTGAMAYGVFGLLFGGVMSITGSFMRQTSAFEAALQPCVETWAGTWMSDLPDEVELEQKLIECLAEGSEASPLAVTPSSNILLRGIDWIVARTIIASIRGSVIGQKLRDLQAAGRASITRRELQQTLAQQLSRSAADQLRSRLERVRWICRGLAIVLLAGPAVVAVGLMLLR